MQIICTIPPYAPFIKDVIAHPSVSGVRINTVMPVKESLEDMLTRIKGLAGGKDIWIDLKCRQIRTSHGSNFYKAPPLPEPERPREYNIFGRTFRLETSHPKAHGDLVTPPWASIKLTHKIKLDTSKGPVKCWFQDGYDVAEIVEVVNGDTLIMLNGPKRVVGGGESINILHPSLEIEGFFTEYDLRYIEAGRKAGVHNYMLSFVEQDSDIGEMLALDPAAKILAKVETMKGIEWCRNSYHKHRSRNVRLMAARGDLYVEVGRPDKILRALKKIIDSDSGAVMASRILTSLRENPRPICPDITDIAAMWQMGYKTFMIGDDICFDEDTVLLALDMLAAIGDEVRRW